jgi:oligoribonuclease NrnB/cAMP/cGMP phosphodiesterase (DHH superfamily)
MPFHLILVPVGAAIVAKFRADKIIREQMKIAADAQSDLERSQKKLETYDSLADKIVEEIKYQKDLIAVKYGIDLSEVNIGGEALTHAPSELKLLHSHVSLLPDHFRTFHPKPVGIAKANPDGLQADQFSGGGHWHIFQAIKTNIEAEKIKTETAAHVSECKKLQEEIENVTNLYKNATTINQETVLSKIKIGRIYLKEINLKREIIDGIAYFLLLSERKYTNI